MKKIHRVFGKRKNNKHYFRNLMLFLTGGAILLIALTLIYLATLKIPDFSSFEERKISSSTKIYDRTGEILLFDIHQDIKRTIVPFDKINNNVKNATIAIEDAEFYKHKGIRPLSILRAILANITGVGKTQGGSTITQQLVKNTLLTQKKTYTRKIKEWILAIKIEKVFSKEEILAFYLNEAPYGGNIYGVEEASKTYFNKNAADLTLGESAYLAAIPQSPTVLSPYGKNKGRLDERKNLVLSRMKELGIINTEEYEKARNENVVFQPLANSGIKAPHFVFFIREYLEEKYGVEVIENGGLKVITTLNAELQQKAETIVKEGALKNEKDWGGSNAALVAIDPKTGQILTMVGSRDYFDKEIDGAFNIATADRQPGSSFKPFIYATAFKKGFTPDTVLFDVPTEFNTGCTVYGKALPGKNQKDCYSPDNYDNAFRGPMSLRDALAQSINIPAVKLFYLAGTNDSMNMAEDLGITTLKDRSRYGLTLVIGGGEAKLIEMTSAYGVFANNGIKNPYTGILQVENNNGEILEEYKQQEQEVLSKNVALTVSDVLSDNKARIPTFGANSPLYIPGYDVAAKTGTTNNNKDAWIIGYSPTIVAGVWAGNNDNKPMKKGGSALAGPIWNKFMQEALKVVPKEQFEKPDLVNDIKNTKPAIRGMWQGGESYFIDKISGKLATELTPKETLEEKTITNVKSILYWVDRENILGPAPTNPTSNAQYEHWNTPIQDWWEKNKYKYNINDGSQKPTGYDDVHTEYNKPTVNIVEPNTDSTYAKNSSINVNVQASGKFPITKMDVFINGIYLETVNTPLYYNINLLNIDNLKDENDLRVVVYDSVYNKTETNILFKVY